MAQIFAAILKIFDSFVETNDEYEEKQEIQKKPDFILLNDLEFRGQCSQKAIRILECIRSIEKLEKIDLTYTFSKKVETMKKECVKLYSIYYFLAKGLISDIYLKNLAEKIDFDLNHLRMLRVDILVWKDYCSESNNPVY